MLWVGVVLLILGFALAIPRGGAPGSIANRNVTMGSYIYQTPGQTRDGESSSKAWRIHALGGLMALVGIAILMFVA
jgi:hypothetical protein